MKSNSSSIALSYVFRPMESALDLKTIVKTPVDSSHRYRRKQVSVIGLRISIIYEEVASGSSETKFPDTVFARLKIVVPHMETYTKEKLKAIIANDLNSHSANAKFEVQVIFKKINGSISGTSGGYISDDADIDL